MAEHANARDQMAAKHAVTVRELTHPKAIAYFAAHYGLSADEPLRLKPGATYSKGHGGIKDGVPVGAETEARTRRAKRTLRARSR